VRRFTLIAVMIALVVLVLTWHRSWTNVDNFTTLSLPACRNSFEVDLSGIYDVIQEASSGDWGVATTAFSNQVILVRRIQIRDDSNCLSCTDLASSEPIACFEWGKDIFSVNESKIEFFVDSTGSVPIFPGRARSRIEGQISKQDDGTLIVKKVFWEKGMLLYVFPFYDEHKWTFRLKPVNQKKVVGINNTSDE